MTCFSPKLYLRVFYYTGEFGLVIKTIKTLARLAGKNWLLVGKLGRGCILEMAKVTRALGFVNNWLNAR